MRAPQEHPEMKFDITRERLLRESEFTEFKEPRAKRFAGDSVLGGPPIGTCVKVHGRRSRTRSRWASLLSPSGRGEGAEGAMRANHHARSTTRRIRDEDTRVAAGCNYERLTKFRD